MYVHIRIYTYTRVHEGLCTDVCVCVNAGMTYEYICGHANVYGVLVCVRASILMVQCVCACISIARVVYECMYVCGYMYVCICICLHYTSM